VERETLRPEVKQLIVSGLRLPMMATDLADEISIFGEDLGGNGLGLDSIDALELVVLVEERFHVSIPDEEVGKRAFASVSALVDFILHERGAV